VGLFIGLYFLAPVLYSTALINVWSLQYLSQIRAALLQGGISQPRPPIGHPRADIWQAFAAIKNGDYLTAITLLAPHLQEDKFALQISAWSYELQGDYLAAIQGWKEMGDYKALQRVGDAAAEEGDLTSAYQAYQVAWDLNPQEGTFALGDFLDKDEGDPAAAEAVYRQALEKIPYHRYRPYWHLRLAEVLEEQSRWAEAAQSYEQAIAEVDLMYPSERRLARRYADLAWAYHMSGQTEDAMKAIEKTLQLLTTDASISAEDAWMKAGVIYEGGGKIEEALAAYRRVLELNPDNAKARDAVQRLESEYPN
jgi:tetratricopeptide (TPR) repeat protein